jgi:hypothetical protein
MPKFIEFIGDESLLTEKVCELFLNQLSLNDVERKPNISLSGWNHLFNVHTHSHEHPYRPELDTVISLRIRDYSLWEACKTQSIALLDSILKSTECDLEFYSFFHLECYRRNGGINLCRPKEVRNHQQFWNDRHMKLLSLSYTVVQRDYTRF